MITLVIIGVIAAITVPTLITKYQKEQTVTRLKKAYSTLSQTTLKAIADNGPINTWEIGAHSSPEAAKAFFKKYMKPYLSILKDCETTVTQDCEFSYSYLNSNNKYSIGNEFERFFLQDGTLVALDTYVESEQNKYSRIYIDINGQKKPNKLGKDIFRFDYYLKRPEKELNGKFVSVGNAHSLERIFSTEQFSCNKQASTRAGLYCSSAIVKSSWTIPDNYPW